MHHCGVRLERAPNDFRGFMVLTWRTQAAVIGLQNRIGTVQPADHLVKRSDRRIVAPRSEIFECKRDLFRMHFEVTVSPVWICHRLSPWMLPGWRYVGIEFNKHVNPLWNPQGDAPSRVAVGRRSGLQ